MRGYCRSCNGSYLLTKKGTVRRHREGAYGPWCDGSAEPPRREREKA